METKTDGSEITIDLACIFGSKGLVAIVETADGKSTRVALDDNGLGQAKLPAPPRRLRLEMTAAREDGELTRDPAKDAKQVSILDAFSKEGIEIDGSSERAAFLLTWDGRCHGENHPVDKEKKKFASWEHIQTAWYVGKDSAKKPLHGPFEIDQATPLPIGEGSAVFGDIICLAGDFYAHFDDDCAAKFEDAWPKLQGIKRWIGGDYRKTTLDGDTTENVVDLLKTIHKDGGEQKAIVSAFNTVEGFVTNDHPTRRFLTLASQNYCHFGKDALDLYRRYHALAIERAIASKTAANPLEAWLKALSIEAFGCHFLTDLFATGHIRTPRRKLGETFGIVKGGLCTSNTMHDEDNELGLWCTTTRAQSPRVVWRAYGDGRLLQDDASDHLAQVQEAVRRSVAEVYDAWAGKVTADDERAEALIPVPLPPGQAPTEDDRLPDGSKPTADRPNHWPRFAVDPGGRLKERIGEPNSREYRDMQDETKPAWTWQTA